MKFRTFTIGYVLVLAVFLFAKRHSDPSEPSSNFSRVVDLTRPGMSTVDEIPADRLMAPLVVLDVRSNAKTNPGYQISVDDIADWEQAHSEIPPHAVVIAETGLRTNSNSSPGYSLDAAQFLVEGRDVVGLGSDAPNVDSSASLAVDKYTLSHGVYHLENVANLDAVPASGSVVVIAPAKLPAAKIAPVIMLAMVR
jgi:kynurenine formamidase